MKDYSNIMSEPEAFIQMASYDAEQNLIHVWTTGCDITGKELVYPATPENFKKIEERLKGQYEVIFKNKKKIFYPKINKCKLLTTLSIATAIFFTILGFFLAGVSLPAAAVSLSAAIAGAIFGIFEIAKGEKLEKEYANFEMIQEFISRADEIIRRSMKDNNITKDIKKTTSDLVEENKELVSKQCLDNVLNIGLIDRLASTKEGLKEIRDVLVKTDISKGLERQPQYISSTKTENVSNTKPQQIVKVKARKPENSNNC